MMSWIVLISLDWATENSLSYDRTLAFEYQVLWVGLCMMTYELLILLDREPPLYPGDILGDQGPYASIFLMIHWIKFSGRLMFESSGFRSKQLVAKCEKKSWKV